MLKVIDYNEKYSNNINKEERLYWGKWDGTLINENINKYDVFKIVLYDDKYAGHLYGKTIGDLFYFDIFIIKESYRNKKIGSYLLEKLINELQEKNYKTIVTTAEYNFNGNINLYPLLTKFNFNKIIDIKGFWGSLFPNVYCEECNSLPCKCKAALFIKNI